MARRPAMRLGPFLFVGIFLLLIWIVAFAIFHVAEALIHLLVLFAVISFILHHFWSRAV
jgi:hypothetical protein